MVFAPRVSGLPTQGEQRGQRRGGAPLAHPRLRCVRRLVCCCVKLVALWSRGLRQFRPLAYRPTAAISPAICNWKLSLHNVYTATHKKVEEKVVSPKVHADPRSLCFRGQRTEIGWFSKFFQGQIAIETYVQVGWKWASKWADSGTLSPDQIQRSRKHGRGYIGGCLVCRTDHYSFVQLCYYLHCIIFSSNNCLSR